MNLKNIAAIVLAVSVGAVSCNTNQSPNPDYNALRSELAELEQKTAKGEAMFLKYCAVCHGQYSKGGDNPYMMKNRETGNMVQVTPPGLEDPLNRGMFADENAYLKHLSVKIQEGGTFMLPITDFPRDDSDAPRKEELGELRKFILYSSDLQQRREYISNFKQTK